MAMIRPGDRPVLLVVDAQNGVLAEAWNRAAVVERIGEAVRSARKAFSPVIWVRHIDAELPAGEPVSEIVPELARHPDEAIVTKGYNSAFEATGLEEILAGLGATRIVLAGAATNWCIRATAYAALDRGYDLCLVADAHTTGNLELGAGRRVAAEDIVAELNVAMTWLSYPDRRCEAVPAAALEFQRERESS